MLKREIGRIIQRSVPMSMSQTRVRELTLEVYNAVLPFVRADIQALRDAIELYGNHRPGCAANRGYACDCGYGSALGGKT